MLVDINKDDILGNVFGIMLYVWAEVYHQCHRWWRKVAGSSLGGDWFGIWMVEKYYLLSLIKQLWQCTKTESHSHSVRGSRKFHWTSPSWQNTPWQLAQIPLSSNWSINSYHIWFDQGMLGKRNSMRESRKRKEEPCLPLTSCCCRAKPTYTWNICIQEGI